MQDNFALLENYKNLKKINKAKEKMSYEKAAFK